MHGYIGRVSTFGRLPATPSVWEASLHNGGRSCIGVTGYLAQLPHRRCGCWPTRCHSLVTAVSAPPVLVSSAITIAPVVVAAAIAVMPVTLVTTTAVPPVGVIAAATIPPVILVAAAAVPLVVLAATAAAPLVVLAATTAILTIVLVAITAATITAGTVANIARVLVGLGARRCGETLNVACATVIEGLLPGTVLGAHARLS